MAEIIRQGDPTSHGGTVIEGSRFDIYMGKPIAFVGHKVTCPKCKGIFPIVEGAPNMTFYGKSVALAGMKTACGATLISTQFTGTVEYSRDSAPAALAVKQGNQAAQTSLTAATGLGNQQFNDKFMLIDDETGDPLSNTEYAIRRASGEIEHGTTDVHGCTHLLAATANAEQIDIYV